MKYPTAFSKWGYEEGAAMGRVINSGRFTMGPEVAAFEQEFAAFHGRRFAVMCNSGSSANLLMVAALFHLADQPLVVGDVALVPALAWATTYAPLVQYGLRLMVADCDDYNTWNAKVPTTWPNQERVRLIVGCSILGNPAPLLYWRHLAEEHEAYFIEDNCESLGAVTGGTHTLCGCGGLMSSASFFYSHQLSAIEGGAVLTDSLELASLCRMLRSHGWTRDVSHPAGFDTEYDFRLMGYNVRPLELHAAIAREQLKKLPGFIEVRRQNADLFWELARASELPIQRPRTNGSQPSPFGIHFTVPPGSRKRLVGALRASGIDCRLPTGGSLSRHVYGRAWHNQPTPNADYIHDNGMFIGNAPWAIPELIDEAVEVMRAIYV